MTFPHEDDTVSACPTLGVLSAAAHGTKKSDVLEALHTGLAAIDPEDAAKYIGYSLHLLADTDGQKALEALMMADTYEYSSTWADSLRAEGEARGEAKAVLRVLARRGVEVPQEARERISRCTDEETLGAWLDRSVTAATVDELFAE
ncbi:hypothetical protein [Nocardiopsis sp. NRRL B-16309]|uniref:hypothetical protein n=1 Tax=Nocardiopsis sp. NRRL B-16309 TaxID=1519494 RepID=UPI000B2765F2|nr:hypothetical protein [Nocardiopsis sp. NRRL B-16309]